ncbi:single-stranded-DNA-specific exonuclease RecJ [Carboxydocella sp. JDF658]|uniref:single-stranded-DNA-specific exonuclease RecJ n=1 Tax=Carboxydocella sp. JDF658 TaxID=1926600 RepID=UPI0009ABCC91|nr:single-stranded-DNA-specific exonuclease RecJ [Carboxydocella sp. JDF658]GAW32593.1 single-stranded-DNA-specific exonuclease [Carboxydocella sp. JDF658]
MHKRWRLARPDPDRARILAQQLGISPLLAGILLNRGITDLTSAHLFLRGSIADLGNPLELPDLEKALEILQQALQRQEKITIYGDYDADGVTATALLYLALKPLAGERVDYYLPNRFTEGYGLNLAAVEQLAQKGTRLLITVDCGIASFQEVVRARELGMKVIITDHHELQGELPPAEAVVNPKRPDNHYPWPDLCGAGIAFKLAQALLGEKALALLDLAAIGTVADLVPLHGENRLLVKAGLERMRHSPRPGLVALCQVAGIEPVGLTAQQLAFQIGPRLNAAGRLSSAEMAVRLLITEKGSEALEMASLLDRTNRERQQIENQIVQAACRLVEEEGCLARDRVLVLAQTDWHHGVLGIAASRLVERYYRPTLLLGLEGDEAKGSGRSIPGFNLFSALSQCRDLLTKFGGHPMAAGLSLNRNQIPRLREQLNELANTWLTEMDLVPDLLVEGEVAWGQVTEELVQELAQLEPYGYGNPIPVLALRKGRVLEVRAIGREGSHLRLWLEGTGAKRQQAVAWQLGHMVREIAAGSGCLDIAFVPDINEWNGQRLVQAQVKDLKNSWRGDNPYQSSPFWQPVLPSLGGQGNWQVNDQRQCADRPAFLANLPEGRGPWLVYVTDPAKGEFLQQLLRNRSLEDIGFVSRPDQRLQGKDWAGVLFYDPPATPELALWLASLVPGRPLWLLYGTRELEELSRLAEEHWPDRERLANYYRETPEFYSDLAPAPGWQMAWRIFAELDLVELRREGLYWQLRKKPLPARKKDLTASPLYLECQQRRQELDCWLQKLRSWHYNDFENWLKEALK